MDEHTNDMPGGSKDDLSESAPAAEDTAAGGTPQPAPARLSGPPIPAGSSVILSISKGPAPTPQSAVNVPSVIGSSQADALSAMQDAGLEVSVVRNPNQAFKDGTVSHQLPTPGATATSGAKGAIVVSSGRAPDSVTSTVLPDVVGQGREQALETLSRAQLKATVVEDFSATVPLGIVMAQEPNARTLGREPQKKSLWWLWALLAIVVLAVIGYFAFFTGGADVTVPNVVGMTEQEAETTLDDAGLALGRVSMEATTAVEAGQIISQDPAADETAQEGDRVAIVVAEAPQGVEIPDVVGMSSDDAQKTLEDAGLTVRIEEVFSEDVAEGDVVAQSPQPGTRVQEGTEVALSVSKGPEPAPNVNVPDVSGMTESEAKQTLTDAGLTAQSVNSYSDTIPNGEVIAQAPASGSSVAPDTKIVLFISQGPKPPNVVEAAVPDVVTMTQAEAEATLGDAGFEVEVVELPSDTVEDGVVVSQFPVADTMLAEGSAVVILVSTGPSQ